MENHVTEKNNILATEPVGKLIAKFAIPSITAMLVNALYNIVDQVFIGHAVGFLGNGAANVVLLLTLITLAISLLFGDGAAAYFSLRLGEGNKERAVRGFGSAITTLTGLSVLTVVLGIIFLEPILRLFGCTDVLMPYATEYGFIIVLGLPFIMISTAINAIIRADGSPRYAMLSMILGAVINGVLDPVFLFGFNLGIRGAAISTFIGQFVTFALSILYLRRFKSAKLTPSVFLPKLKTVFQVCMLGISSFIDQLAFTLVMTVNNNLIVYYGAHTAYGSEIPLTAYGLSMKVQEILFTLVLGVAIGMQPIVGFNYGANNKRRVRKAYWMAVGIATAISAIAMLFFVFFPDPVIRLFGSQDNPLYLAFSKKFFQTYFLSVLLFGFVTVSGVFFQAIGKPAQAAGISLSYQIGFKILSAVLLSSAIGLDGVLWSGPIADFCVFFLVLILILPQMKRLRKD